MLFDNYHEDWNDKIRPAMLARDNFKCQDCGLQHKRYILRDKKGGWCYIDKEEYVEYCSLKMKTYRVYLQVAHINSDKSNNDPSNLKTLCLWCHLKFDKQYKQLLRIAKKKDNSISALIDASYNALVTQVKMDQTPKTPRTQK